jgi:tetratricopeptide (TPR) repeat protein
MKEGVRFYETKSYDRAAESFGKAIQSAQREKLDAAVAQYNAANSRFKMGQFEAAATNFATFSARVQ